MSCDTVFVNAAGRFSRKAVTPSRASAWLPVKQSMKDATPYTIPKEPGGWRSFTLAVLVHLALVALLWIGVRWQNERDPSTYRSRIDVRGEAVVEREVLRRDQSMGEFCWLALRETRGLDPADFG